MEERPPPPPPRGPSGLGFLKWEEGDRHHPVPEEASAGAVVWGEGGHRHPTPGDASEGAMMMLYVQGAAPESMGAAQGLRPRPAQGEHAEDGPRRKAGRAGSRPNVGGGGGHNHPIPALGGLGGHKPPLGEDHNFLLPETGDPRGGRFRPKVGYNHPLPACEAESVGAVQGLGLLPAQAG